MISYDNDLRKARLEAAENNLEMDYAALAEHYVEGDNGEVRTVLSEEDLEPHGESVDIQCERYLEGFN